MRLGETGRAEQDIADSGEQGLASGDIRLALAALRIGARSIPPSPIARSRPSFSIPPPGSCSIAMPPIAVSRQRRTGDSPPAVLLRESYREGGKVKNRTLANLSSWPEAKVRRWRGR